MLGLLSQADTQKPSRLILVTVWRLLSRFFLLRRLELELSLSLSFPEAGKGYVHAHAQAKGPTCPKPQETDERQSLFVLAQINAAALSQ